MSQNQQELEVKFYLADLKSLENRLIQSGAGLLTRRVHEYNQRFDSPDGALVQDHRVLRLRRDTAAWLTYKGPSVDDQGVRRREEIEFSVSDFRAAHDFLRALGYRLYMAYEKFRTTYALGEVLVTLDELPIGLFAEIEGPDAAAIRQTAEQLDLDWEARLTASYSELFKRVRRKMGLKFRDLTFENFRALTVRPEDLGARPADPPRDPGAAEMD